MFLWRGREGSPGRWMLQDCPRPPGCGCLPVTSTPCPAGDGCPLAGIGAPGRLGSVIAHSWASRRLCHHSYRRDLRRHRAVRGAVPVPCRPGVDCRGLRGRDAAAVARQRHQQQQLDVPAGQRAERARRGAGRARHGQPVRDPGGGRAVRRAADAGRRDGAGRAAGHSTCAASTIASTRLATRTDTTSSPDRTGHCRRATPLSVRWMSPCLVTGRVVVPEPADLLRDAGSRHAWPACPLVAPVARRVSPAPPPWRCPIFARSCRSARRPGQRPR
jgi:hypothetical protein